MKLRSFSLLTVGALCIMTASSYAATNTALPGEYSSVDCGSQKFFTDNTCSLCFEGQTVKVWQRLTGLFDTWTNTSGWVQVMYKDEQIMPTLVNLGASSNTKWSPVPSDPTKMWVYTPEIVWMSSTVSPWKQEYLLGSGQKVKFIQQDLGAWYSLLSTDAKAWDYIGMAKFPLYYRDRNIQASTDSDKQAHFECVAYKFDKTTSVTPNPKDPSTPIEPTTGMTKAETGPEEMILIAAAFFIAFGLMFSLRKRT